MMRRRWIGFIVLVTLVVIASGNLVSTAANLVPDSNAGEEKFKVHIVLPDGSTLASVKITPQSLNAASNGPPLEAQIRLSTGCSQDDIVTSSITLGVVGGSGVVSPTGQVTRNRNKLIVRFDRQAVISLIGDYHGSTVTLVVRGRDSSDCKFAGADTIGFEADASKSADNSESSDGDGANTEDGGTTDSTDTTDTTDMTDTSESTDSTDTATGADTSGGDSSETQPGETSDAGQPSTTDGAGAPAAQRVVVAPEAADTVVPDPTVTPTPAPAPAPAPVEASPTSTPEPTATAEPPVPGNIQSAGTPLGPTPGVSWFVDTCDSSTADATGWEFVPSVQPGVLTAAISNGQAGFVLDCVVYVANSGSTPIGIDGVVADFDPAVFAVDAEPGDPAVLQPCGVVVEWGSWPESVAENCWTVIPLTIRLGAHVDLDWVAIGVAVAVED